MTQLSSEQLLTKTEAEKLINSLTEQEQYLKEHANYNIRIARYLTFFCLIVPISLYMFDETFSPTAVMIAFSMFATALTNALNDFRDYRSREQFKDHLNELDKNIKHILSHNELRNKITSQPVKTEDLKSSYFILYPIDKTDKKNKHLIKILINCFYSQGINTLTRDRNTIILSGDIALDKNKAETIRDLWANTNKRLRDLKKLKWQINELSKKLSLDIIVKPGLNKEQLPICEIEFKIPSERYAPNLDQKFKDAFPNYNITVFEETDEYDKYRFVLTGYEPARQEKLDQLTLPPAIIKAVDTNNSSINPTGYEPSFFSRSRIKTKSTTQTTQQPGLASSTPITSKRTVHWQRATYDSSNQKCNVYPINTGRVIDNRFIQTNRLFITNGLSTRKYRKDPKKYQVELEACSAIASMISENPHITSGGNMAFAAGYERDQNGNFFPYSLKIRIKGHFNGKGDIRGFARAEVDSIGNTLYTVKGFDIHWH